MSKLRLECQEEYNYLILLDKILNEGAVSTDRTGVGTKRIFGAQMRFDLSEGFPLLTTKKVSFKNIATELLWILQGSTNIKYLQDNGVKIWDEWSDENGDLGPVYGKQWRKWEGKDGQTIDQISNVIKRIKTNPECRRMVVSAWNVADLPEMALQPCHTLFQFGVINGRLNCHMFQRSGDCFLGIPYNIASYALLTHMIAHVTGLRVGELVHSITDAHIYSTHENQVREQLLRKPFPFPKLHLNFMVTDIDKFTIDDMSIVDYQHHDAIKAPVAV